MKTSVSWVGLDFQSQLYEPLPNELDLSMSFEEGMAF